MTERSHVEEIGRVLGGQSSGRDGAVIESWRRCVELYGMDPVRSDPAHIVGDSELRQHRSQAEWLIQTARAGLQGLFRQVAGQNYVLLLTDARGVCVDFFGDPRLEHDLRRAGLYLGSDWSEPLAGTCAVGACIVAGEAVTIHQDDHFGNAHTALSCTAAPIHDGAGRLSAVLDISLLRAPSPKTSQNLAMSLVSAAARRIEMANLMSSNRQDWVLRLSSSPEFLDVDPESAVTLDGSGRIIGFTHGVRRLFAAGAPILGRRIDEALDLSVDDLPDLMRDRPTEDRVIRTRDGGAVFGHAIAPRSPRRPVPAPARARAGAFAGLAGDDPAMQRLLEQAGRLAPTSVPLLIAGETGCGKLRLARAIHMAGGDRGFHLIDCAGLRPDELPAPPAGDKAATLILRRIETLPEGMQEVLAARLDRCEGLRPITTTCLDLAQETRVGRFSRALFHRVAGVTLTVPPLRHRQDFGWLVERLSRRAAPDGVRLSPLARSELFGRTWPGNLRELEQVIGAAVALAEGGVIDLPDLPPAADDAGAVSSPQAETLEQVLAACNGNMAQAARRLGVNRSTILRRLRKSGRSDP